MGQSMRGRMRTLFAVVLGGVALTATSRAGAEAADEVTIAGEVATLRQAYVYLEAGDHDYHGHRVRALHSVGAACHALGFKAKGDGKNQENQQFSDNLLASARGLLLNILPHAEAKQQTAVVADIKNAIHEIELGLSGDTSKQKPSRQKPTSPGGS